MHLKRSQVAMQFLIMVGIVFVFFVIFVGALGERYIDIKKEKEGLAVKDIVLKVHEEISIAHSLEDGYVRNFTIPYQVEGKDYTISLTDNFLSVVTADSEYSSVVPPVIVIGTIQRGSNIIKKSGGIVCLGC